MKKLFTMLVSLLLFTNLTFTQPTSTSPADGAVNVVQSLDVISWEHFGSTPYEYVVTLWKVRAPSFGGTGDANTDRIALINSTPNNEWDISAVNLENNHQYYWYIKNIVDNIVYEFTFKTTPLISPINSVTGVSIQPTFTWDESFTASGDNRLQVSVSEDFTIQENKVVLQDLDLNSSSYTLTEEQQLENNKTYYWRIRNIDGAVTTFSDIWSFKTYSNFSISHYNPANGSKVWTPESVMFTWGVGAWNTVLTFDLQYMISQDFPTDWSSATTHTGITDFSYTAELLGGAKYYWRVIAKYNGEIVKYSTPKYFTTAGGPVKPIPSYPKNGVDVYTLTPTLYWYTMTKTDHLTFTVRYSKTPAVGGILASDYQEITGITDLFYEFTSELDPQSTYYWQVKSVYGSEDSDWSAVASFKTKGEGTVYKPVPSYPTSNIKLYTLTPTFYWYIGAAWDGAVEYDLYIYKASEGIGSAVVYTTNELSYEITIPLEAGENYKWKVRAHNNNSNELWSNEASFRTEGGGNTSVVLTYPKNNQLISTFTPMLGWYLYGSDQGIDGYQLKYKVVSSTLESVDWDNDVNVATIIINDIQQYNYQIENDLDYGKIYRWAVATFNGNDRVSAWKSTTFRTPGVNNAKVNLSAPANKKTTYTLSPTLMWYVTNISIEIDHYKVSLSNASLFNTPFPETQIITTEENSIELSDLASGSTYYWKVEVSYDGTTYETEGPTWEFYTPATQEGTVMPLVGSPANGITITDNSPVLSWFLPTEAQSALSYEVELANNPEFNNASSYDDIPELNAQIAGLEDGEYYWRVRSKNGESVSFYSDVANFKVGDGVTSVVDNGELPLTFSIDQNYPNPFNPTTTISYSLPKASYVTVKIYNTLGQEVKTLLSHEMKAGVHSINWVGDNNYGQKVSSGTYIYQIVAGNFMQAKKMVLLK